MQTSLTSMAAAKESIILGYCWTRVTGNRLLKSQQGQEITFTEVINIQSLDYIDGVTPTTLKLAVRTNPKLPLQTEKCISHEKGPDGFPAIWKVLS